MTENRFPNLTSPIKVGGLEYRNRIEAAPTIFASLVLAPPLQDRILRMLEDRSAGGCASVVNGEVPVNFDDSFRPIVAGEGNMIRITWDYTDYHSDAFKVFERNAAVIKKHGAVAIAELSHLGQVKPLLDDGVLPLGPVERTMPDGTPVRAFDEESMAKVRNDYATAAAYFQAAGFQGVFIHFGHGFIASQFLNSSINTRTDEYGGSVENRARFPREILEAVRERCGKDFVIEIRVSGQENLPGGVTLDETVEFCRILDEAGLVDLFHVSAGHYFSPARSGEFTTIFSPNGRNAEYSAAVKKAVSKPVAVVGGITTPELAEEIIAQGKADIVSLGRQLIADPAFANKVMEGRSDEIRQCIRCTVCYPGPLGEHETDPVAGHLPGLGSCSVNPYSVNSFSHHTVLPEDLPKPEASRKVLVIGGGPGGMQAAIDACDRGHRVTLVDDAKQLGGTLKLCDNDDFKQELRAFKDFLVREVGRRDIDVRLGERVDAGNIGAYDADEYVIAIGAEAKRPDVPGIERALTGYEVYEYPDEELGEHIVLLGGALTGCEVGADLAGRGHKVAIVGRNERLVPRNIGIHRTALLDKLDELGIEVFTSATSERVTEDAVIIKTGDGTERTLEADTVVLGIGSAPRTAEVEALRASVGGKPVHIIGDALEAGTVGTAVTSAYNAAMSIV